MVIHITDVKSEALGKNLFIDKVDRLRTIIIPVSNSPSSIAAVHWAKSNLLNRISDKIFLLNVYQDEAPFIDWEWLTGKGAFNPENEKETSHEILHSILADLSNSGFNCEGVSTGSPRPMYQQVLNSILGYDADLVVVGVSKKKIGWFDWIWETRFEKLFLKLGIPIILVQGVTQEGIVEDKKKN